VSVSSPPPPATTIPIPLERLTGAPWDFIGASGQRLDILTRLGEKVAPLSSVAHIFQGLVTGADKVFVLTPTGPAKDGLRPVRDKQGQSWELETAVLRSFINDVSLHPFGRPDAAHALLFPYRLTEGRAELIPAQVFAADYPRAWAYLQRWGDALRRREGEKWHHDRWYAFGRTQNLTQMEDAKLIVQVMAQSPRYVHDDGGLYFTGGGNGPYYGLRWRDPDDPHDLRYLQALLNSSLLDTYVGRSLFVGEFRSYGKQYIARIPIRRIDFTDADDADLHHRLVDKVARLTEVLVGADDSSASRVADLQRDIDQLVYTLYALTPAESAVFTP